MQKNNKGTALLIAGVDEAGRGPLAGPVVAAAVILNPNQPIEGLADSKKLTPLKREKLYALISLNCIAWSVAKAEVHEIDEINILQANLLAMERAVMGLAVAPHQVNVDGQICPKIPYPVFAYIQGDSYIPEISAASIMAKVTRDREMCALHQLYPDYGFDSHKGYPTREHLANLKRFGPSPIHRRSFAPVRQLITQMELETES